eukprot:scaffold12777_cov18-Prasinocladus_malaysianus.AAC.1
MLEISSDYSYSGCPMKARSTYRNQKVGIRTIADAHQEPRTEPLSSIDHCTRTASCHTMLHQLRKLCHESHA